MVDVELKVWALPLHWVRRLAVSPSTWVFSFSFWCVCTWGVSPVQVLSTPSQFSDFRHLPCFYRALLWAWLSAGGCFLPSRGALSVGTGLTVALVSSLTTKSAYSLLLIDRVKKIIKMFGPSSSVVLELRQIISNKKWVNAWLILHYIGLGWFLIMDIYW